MSDESGCTSQLSSWYIRERSLVVHHALLVRLASPLGFVSRPRVFLLAIQVVPTYNTKSALCPDGDHYQQARHVIVVDVALFKYVISASVNSVKKGIYS